MTEGRFAHDALCHKAAGNTDRLPFEGVKIRLDVGTVMRLVITCDLKRILPSLLQRSEFITPNLQQLRDILFLRGNCFFFAHWCNSDNLICS